MSFYSIKHDFQGEKNNGFDVLYHNMKYGLDASKEFSDFLRERFLAAFWFKVFCSLVSLVWLGIDKYYHK